MSDRIAWSSGHLAARFIITGLVVVAFALPARAQQTAQEEEEAAVPTPRIEEIVVTGTKREASIQVVPIAVSAFRGEDLRRRGIQDLEDLSQVSPSLQVYSSNSESNGGTIRIRGMGTTGNNPGLEAAVGTFIDGIYRSRSGQAFSDLLDVDRIEILRGPQGTLFGKNTSAGAVQIITKKPEFEYGGTGSFGVGNFGSETGSLSITGPIIEETLAFRVAGSFNQREGYYDDVNSSDKFSDRDRWNVKGQLLWFPTVDLDVRLIVDYAEKDESCCPAAWRFVGPTGAITRAMGGFVPANFKEDSLDVGTNFDPFEKQQEKGLSLEANWDLQWATLTAITSWRDYTVKRGQDIDFTDLDILRPQDTNEQFENFSSELRLAGTTGPLDWLFGGYFFTERLKSDGDVRFSTQGPEFVARLFTGNASPTCDGNCAALQAGIGVGEGFREEYDQNSQGWSAFTHNTWHVTERFSATAGFRWNFERKQARGIINNAPINTIINEPFCAAAPDRFAL